MVVVGHAASAFSLAEVAVRVVELRVAVAECVDQYISVKIRKLVFWEILSFLDKIK